MTLIERGFSDVVAAVERNAGDVIIGYGKFSLTKNLLTLYIYRRIEYLYLIHKLDRVLGVGGWVCFPHNCCTFNSLHKLDRVPGGCASHTIVARITLGVRQ